MSGPLAEIAPFFDMSRTSNQVIVAVAVTVLVLTVGGILYLIYRGIKSLGGPMS